MRPRKRVKRETSADVQIIQALVKHQKPRQTSLFALPAELLHMICEYLCHHCQTDPTNHGESRELYRSSKRALSSLSKTCRTGRDITQPYLTHSYSDGGHNLLPCWQAIFMDTILNRRDLAPKVKYLDLHEFDSSDWAKANLRMLPVKILDRHGAVVPLSRTRIKSPDLVMAAVISSILRLATDVEFLGLKCDYDWPSRQKLRSLALPKLKTLALYGTYAEEHFREAHIIDIAPNLQNLYVLGHDALWNADLFRVPNLQNIKKLVIDGPDPLQMKEIVSACPQIDDIEYYMLNSNTCCDASQVIDAIMPAKNRLRRLHLVHVPAIISLAADGYEYLVRDPTYQERSLYAYVVPRMTNVEASWQLRRFPKLEELGVDYAMIYGWPGYRADDSWPSHGWLWNLLPRQLRKLRVWYVPKTIERDLRDLVLQARDELRDLRQVTIGALVDKRAWERYWDLCKLTAAKVRLGKYQDRKGSQVQIDFEHDDHALNIRRRWPTPPRVEGQLLPFVQL